MPPLRPLFLFTVFGVVSFSLYHFLAPSSITYRSFLPGMSHSSQWSSPLSGYLHRAEPYPNPHAFTPTRSALKLAVLRNAPVETEGFTLALFDGRIAVDTKGAVFVLKQDDYDGILDLAKATAALPKTDVFRNQWRVQQDRTSYPIDRIISPRSVLSAAASANYEEEYVETSVYGFDKTRTKLQDPVDGYTDLPSELRELTGLAWEAREGQGEEDSLVLQKVRAALGDVF